MQRAWCNFWFICNCLSALYGFIKRIIFKFRRKKKRDEDLPVTSTVNHSVLPNDSADLEWDDWGDGTPTSIRIEPTNEPLPLQNDLGTTQHQQPPLHDKGSPDDMQQEEEPEIDYFADMAPKLKKTVLIREKSESNNTAGMALSSRLTMTDEPVPCTSELAAWEDDDYSYSQSTSWEDEASLEAENLISLKKRAEREKRAAEQQRRKMEREAQRALKKDSSKLAVKLK